MALNSKRRFCGFTEYSFSRSGFDVLGILSLRVLPILQKNSNFRYYAKGIANTTKNPIFRIFLKKSALHTFGYTGLDAGQNISRFQIVMMPQTHDLLFVFGISGLPSFLVHNSFLKRKPTEFSRILLRILPNILPNFVNKPTFLKFPQSRYLGFGRLFLLRRLANLTCCRGCPKYGLALLFATSCFWLRNFKFTHLFLFV